MKATKTLQDLFLDELQDVYDAEHRIVKALAKMAKIATDEALQEAFTTHLEESKGHITKVEQVFEIIGEKAKRKTCQATVGLLKEGDEIGEEFEDTPAINAALIAATQKVEHYEIATYGCLKEWAALLGNDEAMNVLAEILGEEEAANDKLTEVARGFSNDEALLGTDSESGDEEASDDDDSSSKTATATKSKAKKR